MKIGFDVMGGDYAPQAPIEGAIAAQNLLSKDNVRIVLIGDEVVIKAELSKKNANIDDFDIVNAPDNIGMGEHPAKAFTRKPNSSIVVGFGLLKQKKIDAFCSNGNTGAMMAGAMLVIKTISGVIRPCISTHLPRQNGTMGIILDVGINADCKPDVLYQFGIIGSIYSEFVYGMTKPKVGLLNMGEEPEKGNLVAQATHELMKDTKDFNFVGNVEGNDLFTENADVFVCDGFTGNIVLKQAEAVYGILKSRGLNDDYFERYNYENYGGTPILGISSTVMIGHGKSNATAVKNLLFTTKDVVEAKLAERIQKKITENQ
jgi:glycerol-3-phosphate acyltransferase PlsX